MHTVSMKWTGTRALLMHNERLANPLDPVAKELSAVSGKRNKTEEDFRLMAEIEFRGGLYYDDTIGPYLSASMVEKCMIDSAKREKLGTTFKAAIVCAADRMKLNYKGPRTPKDLWAKKFYDQRMVKVQTSKTLRTRPCFPEGWSIDVSLVYDPDLLDRDQIMRVAERAGFMIGIGDFRPRFGRFSVEFI